MSEVHPLLVHAQQQKYPESCLYIVATPIGNVADISFRALVVLQKVDAIACEDTRNTAQLLKQIDIFKPLIAAHQHNENEVAQKICERLEQGQSIALVSDAGTPAVSDPGAKIVDAVIMAGYKVVPIPGASAVLSALAASGIANDQFYFVGFLPSKAGQRTTVLNALKNHTATLVFYEAPHRIIESVAAIAAVFETHRHIVFARELTKLFEEIYRCPLSEANTWLQADAHRQKGEYVILLEGAEQDDEADLIEAKRVLSILLQSCSVKQAANLAAQLTGLKKNALYQVALSLHQQTGNFDDETSEDYIVS